jgi:DNA-binding transcriptional regulator YiaG
VRASQRVRARRGRPLGSVQLYGKALPVLSEEYARDKAALHIGVAIQRERERFEVSAAELAARLEVDEGTVHSWERGAACPSVANLLRIAWALGIPVTRLVEEVE